MLQSQDFLGAFYPGQEVGQAGVSWVALGLTLLLPSLLFKLAAQKEKGGYSVSIEQQWYVKVLSMGAGGDYGEPYMGCTGEVHTGYTLRMDFLLIGIFIEDHRTKHIDICALGFSIR